MKEIKKILKTFNGNVLAIGLDEKLEDYLKNNENIVLCNFLNSNKNSKKSKSKFSLFNKKIKISKIRKKFKKKKIDYIICNYDIIKPYLNTFIKDSVYINKNKLYFYGDINKEILIKRYSRYNVKINEIKNIIEIDNSLSKSNFFKDLFYRFIDFIDKLIEIIGDILMS